MDVISAGNIAFYKAYDLAVDLVHFYQEYVLPY